jgi:hypothetical protein
MPNNTVHIEQIQYIFVCQQHGDMQHQNNDSQTEHSYTLRLNKTSLSDGDAIGGGYLLRMKTPHALISTRRYRYRYPFNRTQILYIRYIQNRYNRAMKSHVLSADPVPNDHKSYEIIK